MANNALIYDILVGKNTLETSINKTFSQLQKMTQPRQDLFGDIFKGAGLDKGLNRAGKLLNNFFSRQIAPTAGQDMVKGIEDEFSKLPNNLKSISDGTFEELRKPPPNLGAQNIVDTSKINHTLPTTMGLLKGVTAQSMEWEAILKQIGNAGRLSAQGFNVKPIMKDLTSVGKGAGLMGHQIDRAFKQGRVSANRFDARLLSLLFGGMALKRAFGGALRSITQTFLRAEDETSGLTQATTRLTASWEFFKFSLFDALNTPFFMHILDGIIAVIDWFSQMGGSVKITILGVIASLATLGTALMVIGQVSLVWKSIFGIGGLADAQKSVLFSINKIKEALKTGFSFWLIYEGYKGFEEGDVADMAVALVTMGLVWTVGLGYAIPFYLAFKGIKWGTLKAMNKIAALKYLKAAFPDATYSEFLMKDTFLEGSLFAGFAKNIEKFFQTVIPGGSVGFLSPVTKDLKELSNELSPIPGKFYDMNKEVQEVDKSLVTHSLVPSMWLLFHSMVANNAIITIVTGALVKAKEAIDAIPDRVVKTVVIRTEYESVGRNESSNLRNNSSVSGG